MRRSLLRAPSTNETGGDLTEWCARFQTQHIIAVAFLEGAAFAALVAYMIDGEVVSVIVGAVLLLVIAMRFPTQARIEQWIQRQQELLYQERVERW